MPQHWIILIAIIKLCTAVPDHRLIFMNNIPQFSEEERKDRISSSCEDLTTLLTSEIKMFDLVKKSCDQLEKVHETKKLVKLLKKVIVKKAKKNLEGLERKSFVKYISHPFNSYKLLHRTTKIWPKQLQMIKQHFGNLSKKKMNNLINLPKVGKFLELPKEDDFTHGAINGLFNIQRFYNISAYNIARGKIVVGDEESDEPMSSEEAILISDQAEKMKYLHFHVEWLEVALNLAQDEKQSELLLKSINRKIKAAKEAHDNYIVKEGFVNTVLDSEKTRFNVKPFKKEIEVSEEYLHNLDVLKKVKSVNGMFYDISLTKNTSQVPYLKDLGLKDQDFNAYIVSMGQEEARYQLCQGKIIEKPAKLTADLKCLYLKYSDPYLQLGPLKLEVLNTEPFIGTFHKVFTELEAEEIINFSKGNLKPTPYRVAGELVKYSARRTSKLLYLSDSSFPLVPKISRRIELATRFQLMGHQLDSENYQIMNYGLGGAIDVHRDSDGPNQEGTVESVEMGNNNFIKK